MNLSFAILVSSDVKVIFNFDKTFKLSYVLTKLMNSFQLFLMNYSFLFINNINKISMQRFQDFSIPFFIEKIRSRRQTQQKQHRHLFQKPSTAFLILQAYVFTQKCHMPQADIFPHIAALVWFLEFEYHYFGKMFFTLVKSQKNKAKVIFSKLLVCHK